MSRKKNDKYRPLTSHEYFCPVTGKDIHPDRIRPSPKMYLAQKRQGEMIDERVGADTLASRFMKLWNKVSEAQNEKAGTRNCLELKLSAFIRELKEQELTIDEDREGRHRVRELLSAFLSRLHELLRIESDDWVSLLLEFDSNK